MPPIVLSRLDEYGYIEEQEFSTIEEAEGYIEMLLNQLDDSSVRKAYELQIMIEKLQNQLAERQAV
jgi:hypothetical protein